MARKHKTKTAPALDWKALKEQNERDYIINAGKHAARLLKRRGISAARSYYNWRCRDLFHPRGKSNADIKMAERFEQEIACALFWAGYDIRHHKTVELPLF